MNHSILILLFLPIFTFSQKEMCSYDTTFTLSSVELFVDLEKDSLEVHDFFTNEVKHSYDYQIEEDLDSIYEYIVYMKIIFDFEISREFKIVEKVAVCTLSDPGRRPLFWIYKDQLNKEFEERIIDLLVSQTSIYERPYYSFWEEKSY